MIKSCSFIKSRLRILAKIIRGRSYIVTQIHNLIRWSEKSQKKNKNDSLQQPVPGAINLECLLIVIFLIWWDYQNRRMLSLVFCSWRQVSSSAYSLHLDRMLLAFKIEMVLCSLQFWFCVSWLFRVLFSSSQMRGQYSSVKPTTACTLSLPTSAPSFSQSYHSVYLFQHCIL